MKFGVMIPLTGPADGFGRVGEIARAAEVAGYDSIWIADHVIVPETIESRYPFNRTGVFPAEGTADMLEPIAAMSFLMGQTSRIRFGFKDRKSVV